jgi:MFS family permease
MPTGDQETQPLVPGAGSSYGAVKSGAGSIKHIEGVDETVHDIDDGVDRHLAVKYPESLVGLSEAELAAVDRKATRKIDILLMPTLMALYVLNYLDRQNVSTAKIGGLTVDLNMSESQFATCVAVLFAGYISLQVPSNMMAGRVSKPSLYICCWCAMWGTVSACTGAVQSFEGLVVCRLMLGFTEAAFFPGAIYLLSLFYTRQQLALRTAILYSGSQIGNAFGGLFALACLQLDGAHGLEGWRWLFIVEGAMTVGFAIIFALYMPNKPATMRWLDQQERDRVLYRLEMDKGTQDGTKEMTTGTAFKLSLTDPAVYLLGFTLWCCWVAAAVTNFFPIVVNSLGFSRTVTLCITAPPYLLCIICLVVVGWSSDKRHDRTWHTVCAMSVTILANIIALATTNVAARYFAMMLMPGSFYSATIVLLSWISTSVVGPDIKRAIAIAMINSFANSANIWTSYLYKAPRYILAFSVNLAASVLVILLTLLTRWYLRRQNARLDRGENLGPNGPTRVQIEAKYRFTL